MTYTGTVAYGYDQNGRFGTPNASLNGDSYVARYTFDTTLGYTYSSPNENYAYGGTARIDFYTRTGQGQTLVLVFMYCGIDRFGASEEVKSILRSFRISVPQSGGQ